MTEFFDIIRAQVFGGKMTALQVSGTEELLLATDGIELRDRAYLLATAALETAFTMQPITERGSRAYFNKYEPGTRIGRALGNTRPGDGWLFRGRGYVQITGRANYLRASGKLGIDLIASPDDALKPSVAARILVKGCIDGWFTGKRLADYATYEDMRRVVNGTDRAAEIAGYARSFEAALRTLAMPVAAPAAVESGKVDPAAGGWVAAIFAAIAALFGGKK